MSQWPFPLATIRGVTPSLLAKLGSAPLQSKIETIEEWPLKLAKEIAVAPFLFWLFIGTFFSNNNSTISPWPFPLATIRGVAPFFWARLGFAPLLSNEETTKE